MVTGGGTAEAVTSLSKAEETEVWAQARVSVSRAAVTKHCKLGDLKKQEFIISLFWRLLVPNPVAGKTVLSLEAPGENPSFQPPVFTGLPCVPWLPAAALCSLPLMSRGCSPCVCLGFFGLIGRRVTLLQRDLILSTSAKTLFPNKVFMGVMFEPIFLRRGAPFNSQLLAWLRVEWRLV